MRVISAAAAVSAILCGASALAAPVSVTVKGLEARGGNLFVSIVDEAQFQTMGQTVTASVREETVTAGEMTVSLDVAPGTYAVSVWHDDNADMQFNFGNMGPEDGWGFSGAPNPMGPPTWDGSKFEVTEDGAEVSVTITYGR